MASLIDEIKVFGMSGSVSYRERADSRRSVLLEVAYKLFAKQVYALSLRLLANVRDAEEVTVDVFVKFSRELPRRWDESRVLARLRELAIDESLQRLWGRRREPLDWQTATRSSPPATSIKPDQTEKNSSAPVIRPVLDSATVDLLIKTLPDELRVAFVLHDIEGLNHQAVARLLKLDEATVLRLTASARLVLRRLWLSQT